MSPTRRVSRDRGLGLALALWVGLFGVAGSPDELFRVSSTVAPQRAQSPVPVS